MFLVNLLNLVSVGPSASYRQSSTTYDKDKIKPQNQGYLYGQDCRNHKDYQTAKSFINQFLTDSQLSLEDSCYYLNNYNHVELRGNHRYSRPSHAFKFVIKKNKKYFHKGHMEYCYHGTQTKNINSILKYGLRIPDDKIAKMRNGNEYGTGIYSTKIPEYAELYAYAEQYKGKWVQVILLLRQDLQKIKCQGGIDVYGSFTSTFYHKYPNLLKIHLLHNGSMKNTDIQWMTTDQQSITIQAIIVKLHNVNPSCPKSGQIRKIDQMIGQINQ